MSSRKSVFFLCHGNFCRNESTIPHDAYKNSMYLDDMYGTLQIHEGTVISIHWT